MGLNARSTVRRSPTGLGLAWVLVTMASVPARGETAVDFDTQIVPIFTKHGCNAGGCHGKGDGQNGFRLSLLGFEPAEDHDHVVKESRGRRVSVESPEESLLLLKATGAVPHGGGRIIEPDSPSYRRIARWIAEGAMPGDPTAPSVVSIDVEPAARIMQPGDTQPLRVVARLSDGSTEDVTGLAQFESNAAELADVDAAGRVTAAAANGPRRGGTAAVMARYQSRVGVFQATVPFDGPASEMPTRESFVRSFVDGHVFDQLTALGLPPSPVCDDATFLRRVTIDIAGRIPTVGEVRAFLADGDPAKREKAVDRLLESPDYADYFAKKWTAILRNKRPQEEDRHGSYVFHEWVRESLAENVPYSTFVRRILTATGEASDNPAVIWFRQMRDSSQQVEDVSQLFLGQRLQCAKCHHHPFEKWSTEDYHRVAAFFSRIGRKAGLQAGEDRIFHNRGRAEARGPKGNVMYGPAVLGGAAAEIPQDADPRGVLADWMTAADNPHFARSLVNRYWKHFMGRGLVEPEDDMRVTNPPTNPPLLDALATHFVEHRFDLKDLVRTICRTTTYQLSSQPNAWNAHDGQSFSRFWPRRLPSEVALDAIDAITGKSTAFKGVLPGTRAVQLPDPNFKSFFLTLFGRPEGNSACECERGGNTTLSQSLELINSPIIAAKIASGTAARLAAETTRDEAARIEELYLTAMSRPPTAAELDNVRAILATRATEQAAAWEDVVWALINTKEFLFTH